VASGGVRCHLGSTAQHWIALDSTGWHWVALGEVGHHGVRPLYRDIARNQNSPGTKFYQTISIDHEAKSASLYLIRITIRDREMHYRLSFCNICDFDVIFTLDITPLSISQDYGLSMSERAPSLVDLLGYIQSTRIRSFCSLISEYASSRYKDWQNRS